MHLLLPSMLVRVKAIYLATVREKATVTCLFKRQQTKPPLSINMKQDVDFPVASPVGIRVDLLCRISPSISVRDIIGLF